jgi:hypothetical protein
LAGSQEVVGAEPTCSTRFSFLGFFISSTKGKKVWLAYPSSITRHG